MWYWWDFCVIPSRLLCEPNSISVWSLLQLWTDNFGPLNILEAGRKFSFEIKKRENPIIEIICCCYWIFCCFRWFPNWFRLFPTASKIGRVQSYSSTAVDLCVIAVRSLFDLEHMNLSDRLYLHVISTRFLCDTNLIERTPPPGGGFLFTMFPHQKPWVRGPPSKHLVQILRGRSSYSRFLMREHSK